MEAASILLTSPEAKTLNSLQLRQYGGLIDSLKNEDFPDRFNKA